MHGKATTVTLAALLATALAPSALAGIGIGNGNEIVQVVEVEAEIEDALSNDADVYQGGGDGHAVATCQWIVAANTIILNAAAIEALGLISDADNFSFFEDNVDGGAGLLQDTVVDREFLEDNATATCEQDFGEIFIAIQTDAGWGEPAPLAGEATWLGEALSTQNLIGNGFGGNTIVQVAEIELEIEDALKNDFYSEQGYGGDGHAAANCQAIIGVNTLIVNAAFASIEGTIEDDDVGPDRPVVIVAPGDGLVPIRTQQLTELDGDADTLDTAHAECRQHATSVTIIVGDDVPTIPPQS